MKFIFLFALAALGSAVAKKDKKPAPVALVDPPQKDELAIVFDCTTSPFVSAYCGRRMEDNSKYFQVKLAHRPSQATAPGYNCVGTNAANNYCCDPGWTPMPDNPKRLARRDSPPPAPTESTIFLNIPEADFNNHCKVQPGK